MFKEEPSIVSTTQESLLEKKFGFWVKSNWRTMSLLALLSFASASVIGSLLVMAQNLVSVTAGETGTRLFVLGFQQSGGARMQLFIGVLLLWTVLTSLTRLAHARVLKNHLLKVGHENDSPAITESFEEEEADSNHAQNRKMNAERHLLSGALDLITVATRLLGLSMVLAVSESGPLILGLAIFCITTLCYGVLRFRRALQFGVAFDRLNRSFRAEQVDRNSVVEILFQRDRNVYRIPIGQSILLSTTVVILLVVPLWRFSETLPLASSMIIIMLLPTLNAFLTQMSSLGYRVSLALLPRERSQIEHGAAELVLDSSKVIETRLPIQNWNQKNPIWTRQSNPVGSIIVIVDKKGKVGKNDPVSLVRVCSRVKFETLTIDRAIAEGSSHLPLETSESERLAHYLNASPRIILSGAETLSAASLLAESMPTSQIVLMDTQDISSLDIDVSVHELSSKDLIEWLMSEGDARRGNESQFV